MGNVPGVGFGGGHGSFGGDEGGRFASLGFVGEALVYAFVFAWRFL